MFINNLMIESNFFNNRSIRVLRIDNASIGNVYIQKCKDCYKVFLDRCKVVFKSFQDMFNFLHQLDSVSI